MDPVTFAVVFSAGLSAALGGAVGLGIWHHLAAKRRWRALAAELGLHLEEGSLTERPELWGVYRGAVVELDLVGRRKAALRVLITRPAPGGFDAVELVSLPQGGRKAFSTFRLGDDVVDRLVGCRVGDPALDGAFLRHPVVLATLRSLAERGVFRALSGSALMGAPSPGRSDSIRAVLDDLVDAVARIEAGLAWLPPARAKGFEAQAASEPAASPAPEARATPGPAVVQDDDGAPSRSPLDRLLEGFSAEGRVVSVGEFTLDRDTARERLRRFQLGDPHAFLWLLLRGAVARGARRVEIVLGSELRLCWDGPPVTRSEAEGCFPGLFSPATGPRERGLQLLGFGLNAVLSGSVGEARLSAGAGDEGMTWTLSPEGPDVIGPGGTGAQTTEIRVARTGWSRTERAQLAEELRSRLRFASRDLEVRIGKERVDAGGLRPAAARGVVTLRGAEVRGAAGFSGEHLEGGVVHAVADGVLVESLTDRSLLPGQVAVVGADDLEVDLSQRRVVRDAAWQRVTLAVAGAGAEALRAFVEEGWSPEGLALGLPEDEAIARACLGRAPPSRAGGQAAPWDRLADLPLFPTVAGGRASLSEVRGWLAEDPTLRYAGVTLDRACLDPRVVGEEIADPGRILLLGWPMRSEEGAALVGRGDGTLVDVTRSLLALPRDRARLRARLDAEPYPGP